MYPGRRSRSTVRLEEKTNVKACVRSVEDVLKCVGRTHHILYILMQSVFTYHMFTIEIIKNRQRVIEFMDLNPNKCWNKPHPISNLLFPTDPLYRPKNDRRQFLFYKSPL